MMADDSIDVIPVSLRQEQRCVVHFFHRRNTKVVECYKMLKDTYSEETIGKQTVYDWYPCFKEGRTVAVPAPSSVRPVSACIEIMKNTLAVLIAEDPSLSQCEMASLLDISKTMVQQIPKNNLEMTLVYSK